MKAFRLLLFVFAVSLVASSCTDDTVEKVEGNKYKVTYVKMSGNGLTLEFKTESDIADWGFDWQFEFREGGDFYYFDTEYNEWYQSGTWTQTGDKVTIIEGSDTLTLTVDGSKLIMKETETENGVTYTVEIHFSKM
jgi:uncharacterized protein (UPF0128 family)